MGSWILVVLSAPYRFLSSPIVVDVTMEVRVKGRSDEKCPWRERSIELRVDRHSVSELKLGLPRSTTYFIQDLIAPTSPG